MKHLVILFLTVLTSCCMAQDLNSIDSILCGKMMEISTLVYNRTGDYYDSLETANARFRTYLLKILNSCPQTINFEFPKLKADVNINTSEDHKLRTYSWDTYLGGTMHDFQTAVQYKGKTVIKTSMFSDKYSNEEDPLYRCSEIQSFISNDRTFYIATVYAVYSTIEHYEGVKFFTIDGDMLNDTIALIKTEIGLKNEYGIGFDFFSVFKRKERPLHLVLFDKKNLILKFPIIGDKEVVTKKYKVFKFNGKYFVSK